jgi:hypothetical protein
MAAAYDPLRVAIDARLLPGVFGGVEQVIVGLAHGLSGLTDSPDEYLFLVYQGDQSWLERHLGELQVWFRQQKALLRVGSSASPRRRCLNGASVAKIALRSRRSPRPDRLLPTASSRHCADVVHFRSRTAL